MSSSFASAMGYASLRRSMRGVLAAYSCKLGEN
jgi:hypothetical protein